MAMVVVASTVLAETLAEAIRIAPSHEDSKERSWSG